MDKLIILSIGIFVLLVMSFLMNQYDFFSPSFIVCAIFMVSCILALRAVAVWGVDESIFTLKATFIILSGLFLFVITEQLAKIISPKKYNPKKEENGSTRITMSSVKMVLILLFCIVTVTLYCYSAYHYVCKNGYIGAFHLSQIGKYWHDLTFVDENVGGVSRTIRIMGRAVNAIMFIGIYIFLNNIIMCRDNVIKNMVYIIPSICWLPVTIVTSARAIYLNLIGCAVLMVYIMINRKDCWKRRHRNFKKIITIGTVILAVALILFYFAVMNGLIGRKTDKTFLDYVTIYLGAPIIHFNQFIMDPPEGVHYFGQETFAGLQSILVRIGLIHTRYSTQSEARIIVANYGGNIYTFFRRPLHDFGLLGMYVITALTSFIFSYLYYKRIYKSDSSYKNDRFLIGYGYFFYIIYLFPIDNTIYPYISMSTVYFITTFWLAYAIMVGYIDVKLKAGGLKLTLKRTKPYHVNCTQENGHRYFRAP